MERGIGIGFILFLCVLCFIDPWPLYGARVAGERGVTPAAPQAPQSVQRAERATPPPPRTAAPVKPAPDQPAREKEKVALTAEDGVKGSTRETRYVTIDFDNVDIEIFVKFISELTGKNFVMDKGVKGKVTIISPTKISVDEAYKVFESVLEVHGFTTVPAGNIIKIVPSVEARSKDIETRLRREAISPEDKVVTQLIPLKFADPEELKKLFAPLISKSSVIVSYRPTGMLIVTDVLSNIRRLLRITEVIDVEGVGEELSVVPLKHATAAGLAKTLSAVFQQVSAKAKRAVPGEPVIRIAPDERTNVLIILASEDDTRKIKELVRLLDKETPRGEGDIHVCYLQNANAEDLVKVLMAIPSKQTKEAEKGKAPVVSKEVQITADKATNSLVIMASKDDFLVLEEVIKKLDIARRMVYIEALLMEVSVNYAFDLGVQWIAGEPTGSHDGREFVTFGASIPPKPTFPSVTQNVLTPLTGFSLGVLGEGIQIGNITFPNIGAVIKAFQNDTNVHILSTPQIMTTDNEEAEIRVGKNIPYLTRQETTSSLTDYSNYEYKDVGVTLNITPQINQERFVRLKINQELSQVVEQEQIGLPTTLKRLTKTTVIVKDGNTVVISGLIDETLNESAYQVPCLGGIPGLGWFFKSVGRSRDRTNLFVFLTPHIVENPAEAQTLYEQKRDEIKRIEAGEVKMYKRPPTQVKEPETIETE